MISHTAILGKFAQKHHHRTSEYVNSPTRLAHIFNDKTLDISSCQLVTNSVAEVCYSKKSQLMPRNRKSSPIIGALITARARQFLDESIRGKA